MIAENIKKIKATLPSHVTLVAVSKTKPIEDITVAYEAGQRVFGENKVQELASKFELLPSDIEWHMIGHLQRNKVKYIAPFVHLIHGVDSERLLMEVNKQGAKNNRIIDCLLQVHIAEESTKFGFSTEELKAFANSKNWEPLHSDRIRGLMGMATFTENEAQIKREFRALKQCFDDLKKSDFERAEFDQISMGMSGDYPLAIEEGSTMIRVGSALFGPRNYPVV